MRFISFVLALFLISAAFVAPAPAFQNKPNKPGRDVWVEVFQGEGGYGFFVDTSRIDTPCRHTRRCWVRVLNPDGKRLEAFVEYIEARQARTLGEVVYDRSGEVLRDQTSTIQTYGRSRPFQDIAPNTSNSAVWAYLFRSSGPKGPRGHRLHGPSPPPHGGEFRRTSGMHRESLARLVV